MTPGVKRAALALHGLGPEDRSWILGRIPENERGTLTRLLLELRELGIPEPPVAIRRSQTPLERVRAARPAQVCAVLRREPVPVIAASVSLTDWPWRSAVLAKLPRRKREPVLAAMRDRRDAEPAPALEAALVAALDARLAASAVATARWKRFVGRLPLRFRARSRP